MMLILQTPANSLTMRNNFRQQKHRIIRKLLFVTQNYKAILIIYKYMKAKFKNLAQTANMEEGRKSDDFCW